MSTIANQPLAAARPLDIGPPAGAAPPAFEESTLGFADIVRILKQRKVTIIVTTVIMLILVVIGTFLTLKFAPQYMSEAVFELSPPRQPGLITGEREISPTMMEQLLQTEASKLKGVDLLLSVAALREIQGTQYYDWYEREAMKCAMGLKSDLTSSPIPDTRLIRVALGCRSADEARLIVEKVTSQYERKFHSDTTKEQGDTLTALKNSVAKLYDDLNNKRTELRTHRERTNAPAVEGQRSMAGEYVNELLKNTSELEASMAGLEAQLDSLAGIDPGLLPLTAEQKLIIESDPMLRYYRSQVESLDIEIQASALLLGENHRQTLLFKERRAGYFAKEASKREELMTEVRTRQIESLRDEKARRGSTLQRLQEKLQEAQAEARDIDRNMQIAGQIDDDINRIQQQIVRFEAEVKNAEQAINDPSRVRLRLVQPPQKAVKPSRPNFPLFLGGGAVLALLVGIGVAFLREFTDKAIRTPIDVARHGHLSVLGTIPLLDDEEADLEEIENAARIAPHSLIAENFRKLRTNLTFSARIDQQRTLLVTSPSPGDGKTVVAINLAVTFAHSNQRVLLIDCNFRRPSLRERFANSRPEGLSNVLTGQATLEQVITPTDLPNLSVITTGPMPPRPAELLGSVAMGDLIQSAAARFDRVILDGPPALVISDAIVLAMQVDGVVLVTRADTNTKGALKRTHEQLKSINARVFGAVLNGVRARAGGYFRQQYREFYDYVSDETIPRDTPGLPPADDDRPRE